MKKLFLFAVCLLGLLPAFGQAVSLDTTFARKGWTYTDFSNSNAYDEAGRQVLLQEDGSYLVVLKYSQPRRIEEYTVLARYLSNGTLDPSFGTEGYSDPVRLFSEEGPLPVGGSSIAARQQDGKIVLVGTVESPNRYELDVALVRYLPDGTLDGSFGREGVLTTDLGGEDRGSSLAIQPDGKMVVMARVWNSNSGTPELTFARLLPDGSLDASFDGDGKLFTGVRTWYWFSFALQPDGKIVLVSSTETDGADFLVNRYNGDGSPDRTFAGAGTLTTDFGGSDIAFSLVVQPDGKIVVAGGTEVPGASYVALALARYNENGSLDEQFDKDGKVITRLERSAIVVALTLQNDGRIVAAGLIRESLERPVDVVLVRYNGAGSLDNGFGGDGSVITDVGGNDYALSLIVQGDGKSVVTGFTQKTDTSNADVFLARYIENGSLDSGFNGNGTLVSYYPAGLSINSAAVVQGDGKLVVAGLAIDQPYSGGGFAAGGMDMPGPTPLAPSAARIYPYAALARYNRDGTLDHSFGSKGKVLTDLVAMGLKQNVVLQRDGKIIVGGYSIHPETPGIDFVLARYNVDGGLDNSFGDGGKVVIDFSLYESAFSLVLQSDGKIVVSGYVRDSEEGPFEHILARYDPEGSLDKSFGRDGKQVIDHTAELQVMPYPLLVQPDDKLLVSGATPALNTASLFYVLYRFTRDGAPDNSFDGDGKLATGLEENENALAIQQDGKIVISQVMVDPQTYMEKLVLVRYNGDGSPDYSFDQDGKVVADVPRLAGFNLSMAIQPNGRIIVSTITRSQGMNYDFSLVRFNGDGSRDSTMSTEGNVVMELGGDQQVFALVFFSNNRLYVVGTSRAFSYRGLIVAYRLDCQDREICGNRVDDNCDGQVDEGCPNTPFLTINDVSVSEDLQRATLTVTLSKKAAEPVQVSYFTVDRTAVSRENKKVPKDFEATSGTLTIPAGSQAAIITVPILIDTLTEGAEFFDVHLQRPVHAALAGDKGRVTITDPSVAHFPLVNAPVKESQEAPASVQQLSARAQPNPSAHYFTLVVQSPNSPPVTLKVVDAAGRLVENRAGIAPNTTLQVGEGYRPGIYYVEVVQGSERVSLKLVKEAY